MNIVKLYCNTTKQIKIIHFCHASYSSQIPWDGDKIMQVTWKATDNG